MVTEPVPGVGTSPAPSQEESSERTETALSYETRAVAAERAAELVSATLETRPEPAVER